MSRSAWKRLDRSASERLAAAAAATAAAAAAPSQRRKSVDGKRKIDGGAALHDSPRLSGDAADIVGSDARRLPLPQKVERRRRRGAAAAAAAEGVLGEAQVVRLSANQPAGKKQRKRTNNQQSF